MRLFHITTYRPSHAIVFMCNRKQTLVQAKSNILADFSPHQNILVASYHDTNTMLLANLLKLLWRISINHHGVNP